MNSFTNKKHFRPVQINSICRRKINVKGKMNFILAGKENIVGNGEKSG